MACMQSKLACDHNNGLPPHEKAADWAVLLRPPATGRQHGDCSGLMSRVGLGHLCKGWHVELPDMYAMCMGIGVDSQQASGRGAHAKAHQAGRDSSECGIVLLKEKLWVAALLTASTPCASL